MKKLPIGIQTFSEIIENNYVYVEPVLPLSWLISTNMYFYPDHGDLGKVFL